MDLLLIKLQFLRTMGVKMKRSKINHSKRKNQKGVAVLETIPIIFIFVTLIAFTLGFYGVTQKMILHSISARAYGNELLRHRANVTYLRDVNGGDANSYHITNQRYFTVREPNSPANDFNASKMNVDFRTRTTAGTANEEAHNTTAYGDIIRQRRNDRHYFDQVWVKIGHGICLNASCGE